jgi:hypothetical protein
LYAPLQDTCNPGWSFSVPEAPLQGPKPYDLQGLPAERVTDFLPAFGTIELDDISCDSFPCGGEFIEAADDDGHDN